MTRWLIRHFVRKCDQPRSPEGTAAFGALGSAVGMAVNLLLSLLKGSIGLLSGSVAITADAVNNLSDAASSVVTFIALRIAGKPVDEEHPFGHGRMEYIASLVVSALILFMGLEFLINAIDRIRHPAPVLLDTLPLLLLLASVAVKGWLGLFYRKLGALSGSSAMRAVAVDSWSDMLTTSLVVVSMWVGKATGWHVDGWVGLILSGLILYAGIGVARETISKILGEGVDPDLARQIKQAVLRYDGILGVHDLIVHNYGPHRYMASIHAEVPNEVSIEESHAVVDRAEREVGASLGILLNIHMDPIDLQDERLNALREQLQAILASIDPALGMHDLRLVDSGQYTNLIADIELTARHRADQVPLLKKEIQARIEALHPHYRAVLTMDRNYERTNG